MQNSRVDSEIGPVTWHPPQSFNATLRSTSFPPRCRPHVVSRLGSDQGRACRHLFLNLELSGRKGSIPLFAASEGPKAPFRGCSRCSFSSPLSSLPFAGKDKLAGGLMLSSLFSSGFPPSTFGLLSAPATQFEPAVFPFPLAFPGSASLILALVYEEPPPFFSPSTLRPAPPAFDRHLFFDLFAPASLGSMIVGLFGSVSRKCVNTLWTRTHRPVFPFYIP